MTQTIGIGILGAAGIARRRFVPAIIQSPRAHLVAVGSSRAGIAEQWADEIAHQYPDIEPPRAYSTYKELLEDSSVQAVYIPARGNMHHPVTLQAAAAGKHVLCEKSLACSLKEAQEMVEACEKAGVILQEAFMWRHHPRTFRALEMINEGAIGDLRIICAHFSFLMDRSNWRFDASKGGGALWDVGCYCVNAARLFTNNEPGEVYARANFNEHGADTTIQIALKFPGGVLANIDCSHESAYRCEVELVGTGGRIVLPRAIAPPEEAEMHYYKDIRGSDEHQAVRFKKANQFTEQVNTFCSSIDAGHLLSPAENGLANMRVLDKALRSARKDDHC